MIHYHGCPITPEADGARILKGKHAMVSFAHPSQLPMVAEVCQSFCLDNGAFSAWRSGDPVTDWSKFYEWVEFWYRNPGFDFVLIPDVIEGSEGDNDRLIQEWPFSRTVGVPVWHLHESLDRLEKLVNEWPRISFGSSGRYERVGDRIWWGRMSEAMRVCCDDLGRPKSKLHGLRMLDPAVFTKLPFSSADSTNVARNVGIDKNWEGSRYAPKSKTIRGLILADRAEQFNSASVFTKFEFQPTSIFDFEEQ